MSLFILIGRSGCGKGTQAKLLEEYLAAKEPGRSLIHIETGSLFRDLASQSGHTSELARQVLEEGGRMPAFLSVWNWTRVLAEKFSGEETIILDGSPRTIEEAQMFDSVHEFYRLPITVIHLNISRETARERLLARGRADDREDSDVEHRLDWFDTDVLPAIEHFRSNPNYRLLEIDGEPAVQAIHHDIISKI